MPFLKSSVLLIAIILGYLIVCNLVGVIASFIFDIMPLRAISAALFYAVWFVVGAFCGFLACNSAGAAISTVEAPTDWTTVSSSGKYGSVVIAVTTVILAGLGFLFHRLWWQFGGGLDPYVPDNMPLTITFFVAIWGAMILSHAKLRPVLDNKTG